MATVLHDLKKIVQASNEKQKYFHLLNALSELGLIELPPDVESKIFPENIRGVNSRIGEICVTESERKPEVVYVQPYPDKEINGFKYIYFDEFADIVESQGDMGGLFAGYLRKWKEDPAINPPSKR